MNKSMQSQPNSKSLLSMFALAAIIGANMSSSSVLTKIMQAFPDSEASMVRLVATLPSLASIVITLLIGPFVGRRISYRAACIAGAVCYTLGGFAPVVLGDRIGVVLVCRIISGIGFGLAACRMGYVMLMSKGNPTKITASMALCTNIAAVVFGLLAGYLGDVDWRLAFAPFALGIVPVLLMFFFMKEPKPYVAKQPTKAKLNLRTFRYCLFAFLSAIAGLTYTTGISALLFEKGTGSSGIVSLIFSSFQLGAVLGSLLFRRLDKENHRIAFYASALSAIGSFGVIWFDSFVLMGISGVISGGGYMLGLVMCSTFAGLSNVRSKLTQASTLVLAANAVAAFCTSYYIEICGKLLNTFSVSFTSSAFLVSAVLMTISAAVTFFVDFSPTEPKDV